MAVRVLPLCWGAFGRSNPRLAGWSLVGRPDEPGIFSLMVMVRGASENDRARA